MSKNSSIVGWKAVSLACITLNQQSNLAASRYVFRFSHKGGIQDILWNDGDKKLYDRKCSRE